LCKEVTLNFGVPASEWTLAVPTVRESGPLLAMVAEAAENLVADLERARALTGQWADRQLTEALVDGALSNCLHALAQTGCWGENNRLPSGELWRIAGALLELGSLQVHARFKPRGYAGDFQLLGRIWADDHCDHPLGAAFDRYFQRQAAPQAVRFRTREIASALVADCLSRDGSSYRVVSIGSGPAIDIQRAVAMLPAARRRMLQVTLMDLDPQALDFARQQLEPLLPAGALLCRRENLARLPARPDAAAALAGADFLVCSGLFDYLEDETAVAMLRLFWRQLAEEGRLLVGNFAPHNPTRAYMEWIGNWYLLYRTAQQLAELARHAEIPADRFRVAAEPLGVDWFLVARQAGGRGQA
jgi:hypothetical protein